MAKTSVTEGTHRQCTGSSVDIQCIARVSCSSLGSGAEGEEEVLMSLHLLNYPLGRGLLNSKIFSKTNYKSTVLRMPPEGQV